MVIRRPVRVGKAKPKKKKFDFWYLYNPELRAHIYSEEKAKVFPIVYDIATELKEISEQSDFGIKYSIFWLRKVLGISAQECKNILKEDFMPKPITINTYVPYFLPWQAELIVDAYIFAKVQCDTHSLKWRSNKFVLMEQYVNENLEVYKNHEFFDV
jgi:hypothetical protein